jgi:hypothetical protein
LLPVCKSHQKLQLNEAYSCVATGFGVGERKRGWHATKVILHCDYVVRTCSLCLGHCPAAHSYGYDPLGLGKEPAALEKYRANELLHARWAMLAAAGIIIPEGLQVLGLRAGASPLDCEGIVWLVLQLSVASSIGMSLSLPECTRVMH